MLLLAAVVAVLLCLPATAAAATVEVEGCYGTEKYCTNTIRVTAQPGEANRLRLTGTSAGDVEVTDDGATLTPDGICKATGPRSVRCGVISRVRVEAGDGDDVVELLTDATVSAVLLDGGPGDDVVAGGPADDRLDGGGGRDRLFGDLGNDFLEDGDLPTAPDADLLDGGAGVDEVGYRPREATVSVRLEPSGSAAAAGQSGEGDRITAMEAASGGSGDDDLRASATGATQYEPLLGFEFPGLSGGKGDDKLTGGPGNDLIDASQGSDRVVAGAGNDEVQLSSGDPGPGARVDCGKGFDFTTGAGPRDLVLRTCEVISAKFASYAPAPLRRGGVLVDSNPSRSRPVRVAVRVDGGRLAGRLVARGVTKRGRPGRLRLSPLGRRLARRGVTPRLRVTERAGRFRPGGFRLAAGG